MTDTDRLNSIIQRLITTTLHVVGFQGMATFDYELVPTSDPKKTIINSALTLEGELNSAAIDLLEEQIRQQST